MIVWVLETKHGALTGNMSGFPDRVTAGAYIEKMRDARDMGIGFQVFRDGGYDWTMSINTMGDL